jgi:hypothetical protein
MEMISSYTTTLYSLAAYTQAQQNKQSINSKVVKSPFTASLHRSLKACCLVSFANANKIDAITFHDGHCNSQIRHIHQSTTTRHAWPGCGGLLQVPVAGFYR